MAMLDNAGRALAAVGDALLSIEPQGNWPTFTPNDPPSSDILGE
jgi:hypothetical protein